MHVHYQFDILVAVVMLFSTISLNPDSDQHNYNSEISYEKIKLINMTNPLLCLQSQLGHTCSALRLI